MPGDVGRFARFFRDQTKSARATNRMTPLITPTTTPAIEPLLSRCVSCASFLFGSPVPVGSADSVFEAVFEVDDMDELKAVEVDDVKEGEVVEILLLSDKEVMVEDLLMLKLCDVMILVAVDTLVGTGDVNIAVGRTTTLGVFCGVIGADVPGTDAVAVH